jgi:hypothetical protein
VGIAGSTAVAQSAATQPATQAATTAPVAVDRSSPRSTVRSFAVALHQGDADALRGLIFNGSEVDRRMVDATIELAVALASFRQAAEVQFGKAEADLALNNPDTVHAAALDRIESANEQITGDTATLGQPNEPPVVLRRAADGWQVVIGTLSNAENSGAIEGRVGGITRQATVLNALAVDIRADRHRSMREVLTLLHGQMMKAAVDAPSKPRETDAPMEDPSVPVDRN